jgi:hypothetical protein
MTARIQCAGTVKRGDAFVMKLANRSTDGGRDAVSARAFDSKRGEVAIRHCATAKMMRAMGRSEWSDAIEAASSRI